MAKIHIDDPEPARSEKAFQDTLMDMAEGFGPEPIITQATDVSDDGQPADVVGPDGTRYRVTVTVSYAKLI